MKIREWWNSQEGILLVNRIIMVVLGLFMIGMAIAGVLMILREPVIDVEGGYLFMTIYADSGVIIILSTKRSPRFIIFLAGITFAAMNMVQQAAILTIGDFPVAWLFITMDFVMIMSSILCVLGDHYSAMRLLGIAAIDLLATYSVQMGEVVGLTHMYGYTTFWWMIVECLFLLTYIILLLRPGIRDDSVKTRIRRGVQVVDSMMISAPSAYIDIGCKEALTGEDRSGWTVNDGDSPIESEYTTAVHDGKKVLNIISYRWRGEDEIRMTIIPNLKSRPYGRGFVLRAHTVEEADGVRYLRLYGDEGFFLRILLKAPEEVEESKPEEHPEDVDPIEYVGDKVMSG